jgi:ankyrin repeat protein
LDHEDKNGLSSNPADDQASFMEAAENGALPIMRLIYDRRGVNLNTKNQYGRTPLQTAVRFLLDENVLFEDHARGEQALISAAAAGHLEVVKVLCAEGKVNPNARNERGQTALNHAATLKDESTRKENGLEMAKFLLERGASPYPDGDADGPLHNACTHDHVKMIALLLEHGADPTHENGWSPLTQAIRYKNPESIKLLLAADIKDAEARRVWIESALRYACRIGDRAIVLQILKAGANVNAIEETGAPKGASPLLLAISHGHPKTAQLLIRQGARQDFADENGRLALPLAAEKGFELVVRDLVKAGGDPDMRSGENEDTPLILAAAKGHNKVVKVLLDANADKDVMNKFGDMALDIAEEKGRKETIELLQ